MSDKPEPLSAILAEMRDFADHRAADAGGERPGIELLRSYADRIEAAAERERTPGNTAELRKALKKISNSIWSKIDPTCNDDCCKPWRELAKIADAALNHTKGE